MNRKPKPEHWLYTMTDERASEVAEHLRTHTLDQSLEWLRADGHRTSRTALSRWLQSWLLKAQFKSAELDAANFIELLAEKLPALDRSQLEGWANQFFQMQAVKTGDADTYLAFTTAQHKAQMDKLKFQQRERQVELDARRVALLEKKAAQADEAREVVESKRTPEEKQARLKQIFGMS